MIKGIDISNWNYDTLAQMNFAPLHDDSMFVIMKASEGATYKDRRVDLYYNIFHGSNDGKPDGKKLYGFYHYARPELSTTPELEAANFLRNVRHHAGNAIFALDVEGGALSLSKTILDRWVRDWCAIVYEDTGVKPLIYCSQSQITRFSKACKYDCGLWVAKWSSKKPTTAEVKPWSI